MSDGGGCWGTQSEKKWLNKLPNHGRTEMSRKRLLYLYLHPDIERDDWCGMDKKEVMEHAKKLLKEEGLT